jgi:hypothetical protein
MRALVIEAESQETRVIDIPRDAALKPLQEAVGGWVECVSLPKNGLEMWLNEEGKVMGLLTNYAATKVWESEYGPTDVMAGDVVFTGPADDEGYITELEEEVLETLQAFTAALRIAAWGY